MHPKTLEALKESIAKWEKNLLAPEPDDVKTASTECPLCTLFFWVADVSMVCNGCPIKNATGQRQCAQTPYREATAYKYMWKAARNKNKREAYRLRCMEYVQMEVDFLKSLLPVEG